MKGLFASLINPNGTKNEFRHGNAYANAMFGLAWLYKTTGENKYLTAINDGINVLGTVYSDDLGMIIVQNGTLYPNHESTGPAYMAGRIAQAIFTCAAFTKNSDHFREAERVLLFAFGRNGLHADLQNSERGFYYYTTTYRGASNSETSYEINLATLQLTYLKNIWKIL